MAFSLPNLAAIFVFLVLIVVPPPALFVMGYVQQLTLHENWAQDGNFVVVHNNTPDYDFSKSVVACRYGFWIAYYATNYANYYETQQSSTGTCANLVRGFDVLSLRHVGAANTDDDALSLYTRKNWEGDEIYVDQSSYANISTPIGSLGATGKSEWLLFEGPNFDGNSHCLEAPWSDGYLYYYDIKYQLNIPAVGSVRKGCS